MSLMQKMENDIKKNNEVVPGVPVEVEQKMVTGETGAVSAEQVGLYLLFELNKEQYGIEISRIVQIVEMQQIVAVPQVKSYFRGIMNLRGQVIPVMDLRLRFNMEASVYDDRTSIIVVSIDGDPLGLIVDTVKETGNFTENNIDKSPGFKGASGGAGYISGLGKLNGEVKILIDVDKLLER